MGRRSRLQAALGLVVLVGLTLYLTLYPRRPPAGEHVTTAQEIQAEAISRANALQAENERLKEQLKGMSETLAHLSNAVVPQPPSPSGGPSPRDSSERCSAAPTFVQQDTRPLHLVFLTNPVPFQYGGQISEALWIRDTVLSRLQRPVVTHVVAEKDKHTFFLNDSLIVCLFLKRTMYLTAARAAGVTNIGVYWMGDEKYEHERTFVPLADYVFRNYFSQAMLRQYPNLHWLPNGIKSGLGCAGFLPNTLPLASQRPLLCSFIGSLRSHRRALLDHLAARQVPCEVFVNSWEDSRTKHPVVYRFTYLERSRFTLCPFGNNPETMRHYEALEHGSIPITLKYKDDSLDVLTAFGPGHPLPVFSTIEEIPAFLQAHRDNPDLSNALQRRVLLWWLHRKEELMVNTRNVIEQSFAKKYGHSAATGPVEPCPAQAA
eukprot:RCo014910